MQGLGLNLLEVNSQVLYGVWLQCWIDCGLKANISVSTFSPTFFNTNPAISTTDFNGSITLTSGEIDPVIGGAAVLVTFWGVDHDPYWLSIGGLEIGVGIGFNLMYGQAIVSKSGGKVVGAPIVPGWDPSTPFTVQSKDLF